MLSYSDIIKQVNNLLKNKYSNIKRYGNDTVDKAVPPYFFVECVPYGTDRQTQNMLNKSCSIKITYVQIIPEQVDTLNKVEEIFELLTMTLKVKGRKLLIQDYSYEYIGENNNIPQISFKLNWWESTEVHNGEVIKNVITEFKEKGKE